MCEAREGKFFSACAPLLHQRLHLFLPLIHSLPPTARRVCDWKDVRSISRSWISDLDSRLSLQYSLPRVIFLPSLSSSPSSPPSSTCLLSLSLVFCWCFFCWRNNLLPPALHVLLVCSFLLLLRRNCRFISLLRMMYLASRM